MPYFKTKSFIAALESFMKAWKEENYIMAADATQLTWYHSKREVINPSEALKDLLVSFTPKLLNYEIKGHKNNSNVMKDVKVSVKYESTDNTILHKTLIARIICESAPFQPSVNGKWGVNPLSFFVKR